VNKPGADTQVGYGLARDKNVTTATFRKKNQTYTTDFGSMTLSIRAFSITTSA